MSDDSVTWLTVDEVRQVTGATHEVGEGQLFFSTTDRGGVITSANSVFVDVARFPRQELIGSPHSIVRHPDTPSGCFKLLWEEIQAGRPFCWYVKDLARDGSTVTLFATITPVADAYLSVRGRPLRPDLSEKALALYQATRPVELAAHARGVNRRGTAAVGLDKLGELLDEAGYGVYDEFQWTALLAETEARAAVPAAWTEQPGVAGPLADMRDCYQTLTAELRGWSGHCTAIADKTKALSEAAGHVVAALDAVARAAAAEPAASPAVGPGASPAAPFAVFRLAQASSIVKALVEHLPEARRCCREASTWVALAELHTDALGQFVAELTDDGGDGGDRDSVGQLCQALDLDFTRVSELSEQNAADAATLVHELGRARALVAAALSDIARRPAIDAAATDVVARLQAQLVEVEAGLESIARLAGDVRALSQPQDTRLAEIQIARLQELMDSLAK